MAGERGKLTDLQIRHWVKAGVPSAKADGGGLTFTLSAGGSAGWILRNSFGGRRGELTIGRYPDIGLAEARGIATLKRAEVQQGRNPAAEKQKAKATAARDWTVRDLAKDYRAKKVTFHLTPQDLVEEAVEAAPSGDDDDEIPWVDDDR